MEGGGMRGSMEQGARGVEKRIEGMEKRNIE